MKSVALSNTLFPENYADSSTHRNNRLNELSHCMSELCEQIDHTSRIIGSYEPVPPALFKDAEFLSADDKRKVLHGWDRFINSGYSSSCFTDRIYKHLSLHCGYIAHYNRLGFYQTYWREDTIGFAKEHGLIIRPVPVVFYNWSPFLAQFCIWGDYCDINIAMMYSLRSKLIGLKKELENEIVTLFHVEINYRSELAHEKKNHLIRQIEGLKSEIETLEAELIRMNPEVYITKRISNYKVLFPFMAEESFSIKGLAGNLL